MVNRDGYLFDDGEHVFGVPKPVPTPRVNHRHHAHD